MTNTRLTDPEIIEIGFPMLVRQFRIRASSGGSGRYRGGDGIVRELEFRRPLQVSFLTSRRGQHRPFGLQGGEPGLAGRNWLVSASGATRPLPACCTIDVIAGDRVIVETPGGGGYGKPPPPT